MQILFDGLSAEGRAQFEARRKQFEDERLEREQRERELTARIREAHAKAEREARAQMGRELEEGLRVAYLKTPGTTQADWERNREIVIDEYRRRQAVEPAPNIYDRIRAEAKQKELEADAFSRRLRQEGLR